MQTCFATILLDEPQEISFLVAINLDSKDLQQTPGTLPICPGLYP